MSLEFVLASHNAKKVREFQRIIGERMPQAVVHEYDGPEPVEDGVTFAENALIKARRAAEHTGRIALADDSGIVVDVLGAAPGILSARWAGHTAGDEANVRLLLDQVSDISRPHRGAEFRCTIALVVPPTRAAIRSSSGSSSANARARWLRASFSAGCSSAAVTSRPSGSKIGS